MRRTAWLLMVGLFVSLGLLCCARLEISKSVSELTPQEAKAVEDMIRQVYKDVLGDKIIAYGDTELRMIFPRSGILGSREIGEPKKLSKPIKTISATYISSFVDVSDFKPLVESIACDLIDGDQTKKMKIKDFRIFIQPGGGGGSMSGPIFDLVTIVPLEIKITVIRSSGRKSEIPKTTKGSINQTLSDGRLSLCLEEVSKDFYTNPVSQTTTSVLNIRYRVINDSEEDAVFDKIDIQFQTDDNIYAHSVVVNCEDKESYNVVYLKPYPEPSITFEFKPGEAMLFYGGTGDEQYVVGRNKVIFEFFLEGQLVYGPFFVSFDVK